MYFIPILLLSACTSTLMWLFYDCVTRLLPDNGIVSVKGQKYKENFVTGKKWLKPWGVNYIRFDIVSLHCYLKTIYM